MQNKEIKGVKLCANAVVSKKRFHYCFDTQRRENRAETLSDRVDAVRLVVVDA